MREARPRVLIALDPVTGSASALRAAARLGSEFGAAELLGLFVENAALLRLARLPVVCEVTMEARRQALAVEQIEMQFRAQAARLRELLEAEASKAGLASAFEVARGEFAAELLRAATLADVLVLTHSRLDVARAPARQLELAGLVTGGPPTLIVVQEHWATGRRVVALAAGSGCAKGLRVALAVALREGIELSVLLPPGVDRGPIDRALEDAGARVSAVRLRAIRAINVAELLRAAVAEEARVMVLPAAVVAADAALVDELLDRAECSVMTVR
jgi:hypothetical protein